MATSEAPSTRERAAPGYTHERMGMFADAVLAISITLLVIEIKRPEGADLASAEALGRFLTREWESFAAFLPAFFLLRSVWRRHHVFVDRIDRLNRATAGWHAIV